MSAGSARREVVRAAKLRRRVPLSHPYGVVPLWTPYVIAKAVGRYCAWLAARRLARAEAAARRTVVRRRSSSGS